MQKKGKKSLIDFKRPQLLFIYGLLVSALVYLKLITLSVGCSVITSADLQYFQKKMKCATVPYNRALGIQDVCLISDGVYSVRMGKPCDVHAVHFFYYFKFNLFSLNVF